MFWLSGFCCRTDVEGIRLAARRLADSGGVDVLLTSGGTGLTGRDNAPEAFEPLFSKRIDGFAVLFHAISREKIGTSTIQSRCCAGTIGGMLVFCLPGSPSACRDAWDEILVHQLDSRHRPCNFAEILPRLSEDSAIRRRRPQGATP